MPKDVILSQESVVMLQIGRVEQENDNTMNKASKLRDGKGVSRTSRQAWHSDTDDE
jgi:hypothetical protein